MTLPGQGQQGDLGAAALAAHKDKPFKELFIRKNFELSTSTL